MPAGNDDLVHHFARAGAATEFDALPVRAAEAAKMSVLDTLGVMLAASGTEPAVRAVLAHALEGGGTRESTAIASGALLPAPAAAFANGALAHCLDYDDQTPWGQHASSSIVPAVLAVAERRGGVTGKDLIAAVAAGQDLFARLRCNVGWRKDWNLSTVFGVYAATLASCRAMALPVDQTANALGIASMHSSGVMEVVTGTGSDLRGMYAAFSARGAVTSALLAAAGVPGVPSLFEGEYGVFRTYFGGDYDRSAMLSGLGTEYLGAGTLYKKWPAVGTAHSHIHATIELMHEHGLTADELAEIRVFVGDYHDLMCRPLAARRAPATVVDARFSLPFLVGVAAARRSMQISDFTGDALSAPDVLIASRKVVPVPDPTLDWHRDLPPGRVELVTTDGRRFAREGREVPGNEDNPMGWDELATKFRECAGVASVHLRDEDVDQVIILARNLQSVDDATDLLRRLG